MVSAPPRQDVPILRTAGVRRGTTALFWLLAATAALAAFEGWYTPLMLGLLVGAATVWRATAATDPVHRLRAILVGSILTASIPVWAWVDWRLVTVGGVCAALVLYPALQMVQRRGNADTRSARRGRLVRGLVIGLTIAVSGLAVLGVFQRSQASFAIRFGQPVTVTVGPLCTDDSLAGMRCPDATWTIDGRTYTGTLLVGPRELPANATDVYAYPGDDRAYSTQHTSATIDGLEAIGFVPRWLAITGLIMLVVVALPARVRNRIPGFGRVD